jgi:GNAT superfamily N-acetyltransferase
MTEFREAASGEEIIRITAKLRPPIAKVGQQVWWNGTWGEIFVGRIRRIEVGVADAYRQKWLARRYVAEAEQQSDAQGTGKVYNSHTWESDYVGGEIGGEPGYFDDRFNKFHLSEDAAVQQAIRQLRDHADHLRLEAGRFDQRASLMAISIAKPQAA